MAEALQNAHSYKRICDHLMYASNRRPPLHLCLVQACEPPQSLDHMLPGHPVSGILFRVARSAQQRPGGH